MTLGKNLKLFQIMGIISLLIFWLSCGFMTTPFLDEYETFTTEHTMIFVGPNVLLPEDDTVLPALHEHAYVAAINGLSVDFSSSIMYVVKTSLPSFSHGREAGYAETASLRVHLILKPEDSINLVDEPKEYFQLLVHENVHIILEPLYGPALSPLFLEGFAEGVSNPFIHHAGRAVMHEGISIGDVMNLTHDQFYSENANIHYYLSGSFVKYLADIYGLEMVKAAYGRISRQNYLDAFPSVFGIQFYTCIQNWENYVARFD